MNMGGRSIYLFLTVLLTLSLSRSRLMVQSIQIIELSPPPYFKGAASSRLWGGVIRGIQSHPVGKVSIIGVFVYRSVDIFFQKN